MGLAMLNYSSTMVYRRYSVNFLFSCRHVCTNYRRAIVTLGSNAIEVNKK